jgi:hypothetical protein
MSARLAVARMLAGPEEWSRRRLQVLLAIAVVVGVAVVGGMVWSIVELTRVGPASSDGAKTGESPGAYGHAPRSAPIEEAQPGPLSTGSTGIIRIQQPSSLGRAQVGTGFSPSARGALAQLIAIDRRAIESGSVVTAQHVIASWAAPGGPTPETWSGVAAVRIVLESAGLPANGSTDLAIQLDPAMGQIKGQPPTVCVDFILTATVRAGEPDRVAVADCQHMTWLGGRWVIAAGNEPAATPSLWPGTQASYDAGYRWLEVEP